MKIITMICGIALTVLGVFSVANDGLPFISLAFPVGVTLLLTGSAECLVYRKSVSNEENKHWILTEGFTTFAIGFIVLMGQLVADIVVLAVFGMWNMISGIRGLVVLARATETGKAGREKGLDFYWGVGVSALNLAIGVYAFFNSAYLRLPVLMILGICFVVQGANVIKFGADLPYKKPDLLKTRYEKIAEAKKNMANAHKEVKQALNKARAARFAVKEAENAKDYEEQISEPIRKDV